jgi:hypothetical protein
MMLKKAESVSDFKVIDDNGCRRVSVFGMGWTGHTLPSNSVKDVFETVEENEDSDTVVDDEELRLTAHNVVWDDDLSAMAHYFYNLGREHGLEEGKAGN